MERYSDEAIEIINALHTERLNYNSEYVPLIDCANRCAAYEDTGYTPEEVQALKDAEEQGLLVRLPCKVGDVVYSLGYNGTQTLKICSQSRLGYGAADKNGIWNYLSYDDFGKTVFLTHDEIGKLLEEAKRNG